MAAFERYRAGVTVRLDDEYFICIASDASQRAGTPCVRFEGLARMFSDLHLLPHPMSEEQIRAQYRSVSPADDGLSYEVSIGR